MSRPRRFHFLSRDREAFVDCVKIVAEDFPYAITGRPEHLVEGHALPAPVNLYDDKLHID